ncbi:hypothetical protein M3E71_00350 [Brevibacterium casei]|uniref:hypothetical protein n=1 Tax=Brevibacterium casei TaxID=33889 RepID=UPI00223A9D37|nr:hypothetical protein [Brevibacterium casei]MCT1558834.1 hypothetical protein [Brevibacterium casei]
MNGKPPAPRLTSSVVWRMPDGVAVGAVHRDSGPSSSSLTMTRTESVGSMPRRTSAVILSAWVRSPSTTTSTSRVDPCPESSASIARASRSVIIASLAFPFPARSSQTEPRRNSTRDPRFSSAASARR